MSKLTLSEEAIRFPQFYRNLGVRKLEHLSAPRFHPIQSIELPISSILHYLPRNSTERTIDSNEPFLVNHVGPTYAIHVKELTHLDGQPTRNTFQVNAAEQQIYKANRKLRKVRNMDLVEKDPRSLLLYNYCLLQHMYRYRVNYLNPIQRWNNNWYTAWNQIAEVAKKSERNQFIVIQAPKTLPGIAEIKLAASAMTRDRIATFQQPGCFELLELWRWAGGQSSALDAIPADRAEFVNIIVQDGDTCGVINLGNLIEWRKIAETEDLASEAEATGEKLSILRKRANKAQGAMPGAGGKKNELFQRKLLMFFVRLVQNRMETPGEDVSLTVDPIVRDDLEDDVVVPDEDIDEVDFPEIDDSELMDDSIFEVNSVDEPTVPLATRPSTVDVTATPEAGIDTQAQKMLETGHISAAEARRFKAMSERYRTLPSVWGTGTVGDLLNQSTSVQKVDLERSRVKDIPAVVDKSMLESSLLTMTQDYVEKILPSHLAKSIMAVQRSGIAVTDIRKETIVDALNRYDVYSIKLIPLEGDECTIRFPMQQVQPDGTWVAAGVKYRLRTQRRDLPIHKTKPDEVALSSYDGKIFIRRSRRATHNFDSWVHGQVILNANSDAPTITDLKYRSRSSGLDQTKTYPRILTCLASRFSSFTTGEYAYDFNINRWDEVYGAERVAEWLSDGFYPIGKTGSKTILVDAQDAFYVDTSTGPEYLGDPSELLGLDFTKAPLEITELKIMRKNIPVGFILAYYYGLSRLLEMLGVTPRKVPKGTRAGVGADEFALKFFDETWILPRNDRKVSMLLGGLVGFARETAQFEASAFDTQDVYLPILVGHGLNIRWLRRLDDLKMFFVDPMTAERLVEMREPTTFDGLLMRANEMLVNDRVVPEPDLFIGYERFAGVLYRELMGSVKRHLARPAGLKRRLDFKPDTIWKAVAEDPSVSLIEESNPIHHLKEQESITYSGTGGRSSRSMVRVTRQYGQQDLGIVSEATVDSGDVAINTFTSSNPVFDTVTGIRKPMQDDLPLTSILSTSANMAVGAMNDDRSAMARGRLV